MPSQVSAENPEFLTSQVMTYIGNKRALLGYIGTEIELIAQELGKERLLCADLFSGTGIVARYLKKWSDRLIVNDLEEYACVLNQCYLANKSQFPRDRYHEVREKILEAVKNSPVEGIITKGYAPRDTENVLKGERAFYTHENAVLLDSYRYYIQEFAGTLSEDTGCHQDGTAVTKDTCCHQENPLAAYFLAPLLIEASVHVNTSGVFKGFYKDTDTGIGAFGGKAHNALSRIKGTITMPEPVLSNYESDVILYKEDAIALSQKLKNLDVAYLDPPYNQHPYGSNYFMLNLILKNKLPASNEIKVSRISGIPNDWNRSVFNNKKLVLQSMETMIQNLDARYIIISYNSEGFISLNQMTEMLSRYGDVKTIEIKYNAFKGSRNLKDRSIHVKEYLFVLKK